MTVRGQKPRIFSADVEDHHVDPDWGPADQPPCVGQWCCGCSEHPVGKPWGWNNEAWARHFESCPGVASPSTKETENDDR
jgi:hypothetical protein